jgi:predicted phosphoadenosine phosphosulfate sulfurtransferase
MRVPDLALDAALLATSTAYAVWLAANKGLEPYRTWVEVVGGVGYTLLYTRAFNHKRAGRSPDGVEWRVWRSFVIAAIPIIAGEIYQELEGRRKTAARRQRRKEQLG